MASAKRNTNSKKASKKEIDAPAAVLLSLASFAAMYLFGIWAIDSGMIIGYILAMVGLYYGFHFLKEAIKKFISNDKNSKARSSKRATAKK